MCGKAVRTSSDSPRCAFLQAPVFDRVVRRGTGADDIVSSVVRARQVIPWRAWGSRAARCDRCQGEGCGAPGCLGGDVLLEVGPESGHSRGGPGADVQEDALSVF